MTGDVKKELESLLMEVTEGQLSTEQRRRLSTIIDAYPDAKQLYLEHCQMHTMLAWEHGVMRDLQLPSPAENPRQVARVVSNWKSFATVAAIALIALTLWQTRNGPSRIKPGETVASLTRSVAANLKLYGASPDFSVGGEIRIGSYELDEGIVEITFPSGVEVLIEGPAAFEIQGPELMALNEGRLAAKVTPAGIGFTVETPDAEIVDHGTEFAIEVMGNVSSEVHVFKGEVEVHPKQSEPTVDPVRLFANQATHIDHSTLIPLGISIDEQKFLRNLDEPQPTYSGRVRELQPLAYYRMAVIDDGFTLKDAAKGHGMTATVIKGDTRRQPFAPGRIGSSLRLGGPRTGGYAQISPDLQLPADEFTIMAWVRAKTLPRDAILVSDADRLGIETLHFGFVGDHGQLGLTLTTETQELQVLDPTQLPLEDWTHVAVVKSTAGLQLYRDGVLVSIQPVSDFAAQVPGALSIGGSPQDLQGKKRTQRKGFWHGRIDELALFETALTSEQIAELYRLTPST